MKIVTGRFAVSVLMSALVVGVAGAAYAQSGGANNAGLPGLGVTPGPGPSASPGPTPGLGTAPAAPAMGATSGGGAGPNLSTARANGTSLYANPDPRAPGLAGRVAPPR
ncbi:hypothetical protein [Paraburkholderia dilworthii]|uniref:Uncharacterized protein n=1 Tax=Paraburkholderia dilworthii TaxID=948106 RepID=A0ABW9DG55_9BURK